MATNEMRVYSYDYCHLNSQRDLGILMGVIKSKETRIKEFMSRLRIGYKSGCWIWQEEVGQVLFIRPKFSGHLSSWWAYTLFKGTVPKNQVIHHTCENRECVNPNHLESITQEEHQKHHYPKLVL